MVELVLKSFLLTMNIFDRLPAWPNGRKKKKQEKFRNLVFKKKKKKQEQKKTVIFLQPGSWR